MSRLFLFLVPFLLAGCAATQKDHALDQNGSFDQHITGNIINLPQYPEGIPIGIAGFCKSPYTPTAGLVDVRGYKAGDNVVCPYTNKIFTVPH